MNVAPRNASHMVVQVVVNPAAGRRCTDKAARLAAAFERAGASLIRSECGPGRDVAVDPGATHLCAVGGDGTVRHAALAARGCGRNVSLSFYPAGTINLLYREASCDLDPDLYAARILRGDPSRRQFAATIGDSLFLACASVGPDSAAVAALSPVLKRRIGRLAYAIAFVKVLVAWPRDTITLRSRGRELRCEAFYVAKGRFFAGPWSFAPEASLGDPTLHVVALAKATRWRFCQFIWALVTRNRIERLTGATCFTCTELRAECAMPLPVQADGDLAAALPVDIQVIGEPFEFC